MNTKFLGSLLLLAGLTASNIEAKSRSFHFQFANKTDQNLMFSSNSAHAIKIKPGKFFSPEMNDDGSFMPFKVCTKDHNYCLNINLSDDDSHTIECCNGSSAHSLDNKFDIHMKHGSLMVKGSFFFNIFKKESN